MKEPHKIQEWSYSSALSRRQAGGGELDHVDIAAWLAKCRGKIVLPVAEEKDPGVVGVWRNLRTSVRSGWQVTTAVLVRLHHGFGRFCQAVPALRALAMTVQRA